MHFLWVLRPNPQAGMNRRSFNRGCGSTSKNTEVFITYVNCIQNIHMLACIQLDSMFLMISECNFHRDFYSNLNSRDLSREKPQQASCPKVIWQPASSLNFQSLVKVQRLIFSPVVPRVTKPPCVSHFRVVLSGKLRFSCILFHLL